MSSGESSEREERWWRAVLLGTHSAIRLGRTFFQTPAERSAVQALWSALRGAGAPLMRLIGKGPWAKNPKYCGACFKNMEARRGGIEIECSFLFADVRGSTPLAERMAPSQFRALMDRFYDTAAPHPRGAHAIVDKFVGDEVIGIFIPGLAGELHAARAIAAARALLSATGHDTGGAWVPVGAGVHTGIAFIGTVGEGPHIEFTAPGDPVNVTARLASTAGAGEVLVTLAAAEAAKLPEDGLEHRELELKGKSELTSVLVVHA